MSTLLIGAESASTYVPNLFWVWPFVAILLAIAILPLMRKTHHWWEENQNKLLVAAILAVITLGYYHFRGTGVEQHEGGDEGQAAVTAVEGQQAEPAEHPTPEIAAHPKGEGPGVAVEQPAEHVGEAPAVAAHEAGEAAEGEHSAHEEHAVHRTAPGMATVLGVLDHAVMKEYIPFIVLLFSLYVIAGGIVVRGDIRATPLTNTTILGIGGVLASFVGTTGAAMLLIRLLLKTNSERKHVVHTVVFFIFIVANIGGTLLPIGDPPLFLGYLRGVKFFWTLHLWKEWAFMIFVLLVVYYVWDTWAYRREQPVDVVRDRTEITPLGIAGLINIIWIFGVVAAVAMLDPSKSVPGTNWKPVLHFGGFEFMYIRECVQLLMALLSWMTTQMVLRKENQFNFVAIGEVACLFIGIFITMQVPIEILRAKGAEMGLTHQWHFFWATGILSSFLDNAPTYVVFFETAASPGFPKAEPLVHLVGGGNISELLLYSISCGAVFMGANSYIGNGPNFMVKSIAEQSGVKMPSFFGYMVYSTAILIPLFLLLTVVFFRG
ncbi:MAG: sodium:proton antiporter [Phycisphaerae bacterium]|nr:sodium:proton antiporter [Phycisphaerae bacterium]